MAKNSYFQLENTEGGIYLNIIKAEGGRELTLNDLIAYCEKKSVPHSGPLALRTAFDEALNKGTKVKISDESITPFAGWCEYSKSTDNMRVIAVMYPGMIGRTAVNEQEVMADLANIKVKYGIDNSAVADMVMNGRFFEEIQIAAGTPAEEGYDAEITYHFNTKTDSKPKLNEDGSVDFHSLDIINKVNKGDVVATIRPEYAGKDGKDVCGSILKPKKVYKKSFKYSKNLAVSEDGLALYSLVTGHVALIDDKVTVSDEFVVETDVGNETGDIDFEGNVHIKGSVIAGFKVSATGNIVVDKVVEGAKITAGGNIILRHGIQGMNKGELRAGGNIVATFIESAIVHAGGGVQTDAILHSKVSAVGTIEVAGKNGYLIGGVVRGGQGITAKIIGSEMGTNTIVGVGSDPELTARLEELKKDIVVSNQNKEKLSQILTALRKRQETEGKLDAAKAELFQKSMKNSIMLDNHIKEIRAEYSKCNEMLTSNDNARIKITGSIYPGTKLEIGNMVFFVREKYDFCQFAVVEGDISRLNL